MAENFSKLNSRLSGSTPCPPKIFSASLALASFSQPNLRRSLKRSLAPSARRPDGSVKVKMTRGAPPAAKLKNQILPPPFHGQNFPTAEARRKFFWLDLFHRARPEDFDGGKNAAGQNSSQFSSQRFDFRQFGHGNQVRIFKGQCLAYFYLLTFPHDLVYNSEQKVP